MWQGAVDTYGYGTFHDLGRSHQAHRWAYENFVGPVPQGLQLDHLCNRTLCVNPAHLEPVTNAENQRRKTERTTTCGTGRHPYPGPGVKCRACDAARARQYRIRQKQQREKGT